MNRDSTGTYHVTATGAVQTARRLVDLFDADNRRRQQMTFPTASKAMLSLIEAGIARELTGQRRNRVFVYDACLSILNEGGQPL